VSPAQLNAGVPQQGAGASGGAEIRKRRVLAVPVVEWPGRRRRGTAAAAAGPAAMPVPWLVGIVVAPPPPNIDPAIVLSCLGRRAPIRLRPPHHTGLGR
jgi:hypothetical protein